MFSDVQNLVSSETEMLPAAGVCHSELYFTLLGSPPVLLKMSTGRVSRTLTGASSAVCLRIIDILNRRVSGRNT